MYEEFNLPGDLREAITRELEHDERAKWVGQPNASRAALKALPMVFFAIPWTAFAVFWMCAASGFKVPDFHRGWSFFPLFGLPFLFIGFGMLLSPLWAARGMRRTVYVVTDRRAFIYAREFWNSRVQTFGPDSLGRIHRTERADGSGSIFFETALLYPGAYRSGYVGNSGFFEIRDVRKVEEMIRQIPARAAAEEGQEKQF